MQQQTTRRDQHQRKEKTTMKATTSHRIPKSIACIAAAIAVATPGLASAEFGDRARARIQTIATNGGVILSNVREAAQERIGDDRPLANAIGGAKGSAAEVFEKVRQMHVLEQLRETAEMMKQMQAGYKRFSGGGGCGGTCAGFRSSLKNTVHNFVELVLEVPALRSARGLTENLQRSAKLIDHVPPRALYLMWHATSDNVAELEHKTNEIRQILASLPPLMPASGFGADSSISKTSNGSSGSGGFCEWANQDKKPVFELVQGELERLGWQIASVADLIPDVAVKAEAGATAGAAVANGLASGGVGVKPTDAPKTLLKGIALIPQHLSWAIKLNILRAKVVCKNR
jgi:hypothetical protein